MEIKVTDNGCGIPKENTEDVFAAFVRSENSRGTLGSGLGLSIAKSIVESHGGAISVSSEENVGSCFTVVLPLADDATEAEAQD